ncbi:MAG: hypothetical protein NVS9B4_00020 [Candidatus Acidiferrum sp.]
MSAPTLYDLTDDVDALANSMELVAPEDESIFLEDFSRALTAQASKVDATARFHAHLESQIALADAEIQRLEARKRSFASLLEQRKRFVQYVMESTGRRTLDGKTATFTLRQCPPALDAHVNIDEVPAEYKTVTTTVEVNKRAIKTAIQAGVDVPGAVLAPTRYTLVRK